MTFDELYNKVVLTPKSVLEAVDEYTLYCFYTEIPDLTINSVYNAPYRQDNIPSFGVFNSRQSKDTQYLWKDLATGESGNIFSLISKIYNISYNETLKLINQDFDLGYNTGQIRVEKPKINLYTLKQIDNIKISVINKAFSQKGLSFWKQFGISTELLEQYNTTQVEFYWTHKDQQYPKTAPDPGFAYRIGNYYQLYFPYNPREDKFRNDYPENYFFGYMQLPDTGHTLIIDKSAKDVIFCASLGYHAVCGKSETTMIPDYKMEELLERFETVFISLDNDNAGKTMMNKYLEKYPTLQPRFIEEAKDKTDLCLLKGVDYTKNYLTSLYGRR